MSAASTFIGPKVRKTFAAFLLLTALAGRGAAEDAAQLRILLVIDTHCGKRGGDFEIHRRYALNCLNNLRGVINGASAEFKGRVFLDVLQDEHVTPQKIRNYYRKKIGYNPRNHLLFYYGGHGSVDKKHGHYFAMSGGNILRREVFNLMADTGAPGIYILTDCCSSYGTYDPKWLAPVVNAEVRPETLVLAQADVRLLNAVAARSPIASLAPDIVRAGFLGQTVVNRRANVNMFYDLFFRPQGVHSITAASEGTYGWGDNFTVALAEYLTASSSSVRPDGKTGTVTWDNFFFKVRNRTNTLFHAARSSTEEGSQQRKSDAQVPHAFRLGNWPINTRRPLLVSNQTGHKLRVRIKYYELDFINNTWGWNEPENPYTLGVGAETTLVHQGRVISGSKVRIWAESEDGQYEWDRYRDEDLLLAPADGFLGPVERFNFTFNAPKEE